MRDSSLQRSVLTPELYAAYRATDYVALSSPPLTLSIDQTCPALDLLLALSGKQAAAFITAWNPHGQARTQEQNDRAHRALLDELRQRGCAVIEGEGRGRSRVWPPERSVLAVGIDQAGAEEVGRQFRQNAVVIHEVGGVSWLLVLV
ncbi:MAG: DUF3293 domain-containing protein [Betaproteobacteria bacterium]|nr:DUF3293 domain-containing protein [Betaproteobacteria bacterium]